MGEATTGDASAGAPEWRFFVQRCVPEELLAIRQAVLRPHQRLEEVRFAGDEAEGSAHFCARDEAGKVVGAASVWPEAPPWRPEAGAGEPSHPDRPAAAGGELWRMVGPPGGPGRSSTTPAWRLRAMATAPGWRRQGIGSSLMSAVVGHVAAAGGGLLWCNARLAAVAFYEGCGFQKMGDVWEEPVIGPHVAMWRLVAAAAGAPREAQRTGQRRGGQQPWAPAR